MDLPFVSGPVNHEYFIVEFSSDGDYNGRGFYATFTIEEGELHKTTPIETVNGYGKRKLYDLIFLLMLTPSSSFRDYFSFIPFSNLNVGILFPLQLRVLLVNGLVSIVFVFRKPPYVTGSTTVATTAMKSTLTRDVGVGRGE